MSTKTPVAVPETVLKKRQRNEKIAAQKAAEQKNRVKKNAAARKLQFKRAQAYVKEYRSTEKNLIRLRRQAKKAGNFYIEPEAKVAFVIRIAGINGLHPRTKKILQLLRLRQINNGVFVKLNKPMINMLRLVEPYITWGYPSVKSIKDLMYKRGYLKVGKQRLAITDNHLIETHLAQTKPECKHIVCIEDIIHEIATVGPAFKQVNNSLYPFKLSSPLGGLKNKKRHFLDDGDFGCREDKINALIKKMN